jgi:hypothetical protein
MRQDDACRIYSILENALEVFYVQPRSKKITKSMDAGTPNAHKMM